MVARMGGDEFVVLLEEIETPEDAVGIANKIRCAVRLQLPIDGLVLHPRTSLGIAVYPEDGLDAEQLLKHADKAMYLDKHVNSMALG